MIKIEKKIELKDFKAWSGGRDRLDQIIEQDLLKEVEDYINSIGEHEPWTETELNNLLWYNDYINNDLIDWEK